MACSPLGWLRRFTSPRRPILTSDGAPLLAGRMVGRCLVRAVFIFWLIVVMGPRLPCIALDAIPLCYISDRDSIEHQPRSRATTMFRLGRPRKRSHIPVTWRINGKMLSGQVHAGSSKVIVCMNSCPDLKLIHKDSSKLVGQVRV